MHCKFRENPMRPRGRITKRNDVIRLDNRIFLFSFALFCFFLSWKIKLGWKKSKILLLVLVKWHHHCFLALSPFLSVCPTPSCEAKCYHLKRIIRVPCPILLRCHLTWPSPHLFSFQCWRTLLSFCSRHQFNVVAWYLSKLQLKHFLLSVNTKIASKAVIWFNRAGKNTIDPT